MKITVLDFYKMQRVEYPSLKAARQAEISFSYAERYVSDWNLKNDANFNEWLEVNCHNNEIMIVPTSALYSTADLFAMVEYWHESIAFGRFGDESVAFDWNDKKMQQEWDNFTTDKWLKSELKTWEDLTIDTGMHDNCDHWDELELEFGSIESAEDLTAEQEARQDEMYGDCEDYQIDQYIYDTGHGYYGAADISRETKRAYILQINEYAEGLTV